MNTDNFTQYKNKIPTTAGEAVDAEIEMYELLRKILKSRNKKALYADKDQIKKVISDPSPLSNFFDLNSKRYNELNPLFDAKKAKYSLWETLYTTVDSIGYGYKEGAAPEKVKSSILIALNSIITFLSAISKEELNASTDAFDAIFADMVSEVCTYNAQAPLDKKQSYPTPAQAYEKFIAAKAQQAPAINTETSDTV